MTENSCFGAKKGRVGRVNFNLYHYAGNNPVKYVDPDGRLMRDSAGKIKSDYIGTIKSKNINYSLFMLWTDKENPILGFKPIKYGSKSDLGGKEFADGEFVLFPDNMTYEAYAKISEALNIEMSRTRNLKTLLNDECREINKSDVQQGDLVVQYAKVNRKEEAIIHKTVSKVEKNIFGNTVIYCEINGKPAKVNEKDYAGDVRFYRKNED